MRCAVVDCTAHAGEWKFSFGAQIIQLLDQPELGWMSRDLTQASFASSTSSGHDTGDSLVQDHDVFVFTRSLNIMRWLTSMTRLREGTKTIWDLYSVFLFVLS